MKEPIDSLTEQPRRARRRFSRLTLILGATALVVILGLAIGLGVGLGIGNKGGDNSQPSSTASPTPTFTFDPINGTSWQPPVNSTWQIVLSNAIDVGSDPATPDVDIFDIDLFTNTNETIATLHRLGKRVICYFSAGSYEPDRPDSSRFLRSDLGKVLDGWPDEKWLNISSNNVRNIMAARIQLASQKGCDAIDPDNVDGYANKNGLGLTPEDSIDYMKYLATQASQYNMSIGLKNAGDIVANLTSIVQFSVNEQCVKYSECDVFTPFIEAGKPVFHIEYPDGAPGNVKNSTAADMCSGSGDAAGSALFSTVLKDMDLDGWVQYCDGVIANTTVVSS